MGVIPLLPGWSPSRVHAGGLSCYLSNYGGIQFAGSRTGCFYFYCPHPKDDGRLCFHKNLSVNILVSTPIWLTGGYTCLADRGGGTPIWLMGGIPSFLTGVPHPTDSAGRVPPSDQWEVPHWDWMGYSNIRTGWGTPYPPLVLDGGTPCQDGMGYPPQKTEQQSKHLLYGGRYACCVHAGGLSCSSLISHFPTKCRC